MDKISAKQLFELYKVFLKIGCFSFGGGYAAIPLIEHEIVQVKKWIEQKKLIDIFSVSQSLPGAVALNSSAFVGYYIAGIPGAIVSLIANLTLPVFIILALSMLLNAFGDMPVLKEAFFGIRPVVGALILNAAYKISKSSMNIFSTVVTLTALFFALIINIGPIPLIISGAVLGIIVDKIKLVRSKI